MLRGVEDMLNELGLFGETNFLPEVALLLLYWSWDHLLTGPRCSQLVIHSNPLNQSPSEPNQSSFFGSPVFSPSDSSSSSRSVFIYL